MIKELSIKNFKSVKELNIDCRRVNLYIREPNTGKSNILEALGLLSCGGHGGTSLEEYVRFQSTENLFYDNLTDESVDIGIIGIENSHCSWISITGAVILTTARNGFDIAIIFYLANSLI